MASLQTLSSSAPVLDINAQIEQSCTSRAGLRVWFSLVCSLTSDKDIPSYGLQHLTLSMISKEEQTNQVNIFEKRNLALRARMLNRFSLIASKKFIDLIYTSCVSIVTGDIKRQTKCHLSETRKTMCSDISLVIEDAKSPTKYRILEPLTICHRYIPLLIAFTTIANIEYFIVDAYARHMFEHGSYGETEQIRKKLETSLLHIMNVYNDCFTIAWNGLSDKEYTKKEFEAALSASPSNKETEQKESTRQ
jgi:hypothetical protein